MIASLIELETTASYITFLRKAMNERKSKLISYKDFILFFCCIVLHIVMFLVMHLFLISAPICNCFLPFRNYCTDL